jgi:hypothetical protein
MALDKETLQEKIESAFRAVASTAAGGSGDQREKIITQLANDLSDAIHSYVKTATVNITSVSGVTTGASVSGPGTGTLA